MSITPEPHPGLARLREALCAFPSGDFSEALRFATFATRCVREIPPGLSRSTLEAVADPRLHAALETVGRWLAHPAPDILLLDVSDDAIRAAAETGGDDPRLAVGAQAAAWAVACAVAAAAYAAMIGTEPGSASRVLDAEEHGSDASRYALLAATCAVQAVEAGQDAVTVAFQCELMQEVWPLPVENT